MTLDEVLAEWDSDSRIDPTDLSRESLAIPSLHSKWLRKQAYARLRLKQLMAEQAQLKLAKHEFYTQGPTSETERLGWRLPAVGRVLNKDASVYVDADKDVVAGNLSVAYQAEIVASIELIMKDIFGRNWHIGRALEDRKQQMGN